MKTKWLSVVCCLPLICGCSALSVAPTANSRFTSETVRLGMTKEQFVEQFGRPFKESFFRDEHGVLHETLYYKEFMGSWYAVNTLFRFEDSVLVAQEQGDEERPVLKRPPRRLTGTGRFPSASAAFGPSRIKTDLSARTGKKGPDFRHATHSRGNTQRSRDRVGALSFRMENARKKAVRKIPGSPYSERSIYNPRNGGGRVYQYSTVANSSFPL